MSDADPVEVIDRLLDRHARGLPIDDGVMAEACDRWMAMALLDCGMTKEQVLEQVNKPHTWHIVRSHEGLEVEAVWG